MTLNEYQQKTHETAVYPQECAKEYLLLGLAGEVGEICNKYKKTIRDSKPIDKDDMISELGDAMWYVSELCNLYKIELEYCHRSIKLSKNSAFYSLINILNQTALIANLYEQKRDEIQSGDTINRIRFILEYIYSLCYNFDIDPDEILTKNIAKLQDRKNRGVIQGSGDNR